jgi:hypothetical protein
MSERHPLELTRSLGDRLGLDAYRRDFAIRDVAVRGRTSWKFERRQHFREQGDPSWEAFQRGEWDTALRLLEDKAPALSQAVREEEERDNPFLRVRVVEEPLMPYLQWELHALRVQAECGRGIRVVTPERFEPFERGGPLPEVVVLGDDTLYEVLYTSEGDLCGGIRYQDAGLTHAWADFIGELYEAGEDVASYVDRYVARLPAPSV